MGVLVVRVPPDELESCSDWLWQLGATAIEERSSPETESDSVLLIVGFGHDDLALAARDVLVERWPSRFEDTGDEAAWRDEWMKWIEPIEVAGFVVHAPWNDPAIWHDWPQDLGELSIDPGRAFGSGHHPTTRLALTALRDLVDSQFAGRPTVLDVGCGTGILSVAAAKMGAASVLGIDLDYDIIEVADANVEANGVAAAVDLRTDPIETVPGRFDVVVANIVIGDLLGLMPAVVDKADGFVVISGFLNDQFERLLANVDVTVLARSSLDDWGCAVLTPTS